ncbi:MAG: ATP-binding protein [Myxococcota bacterium]
MLFALMLGGAFWYMDHDDEHERWLRDLTHFAEAVVPPADASRERLDRWAGAFAKPLRLDLAVYAADGTELARAGGPVPPPPAEGPSRWIAEHGRRRTIALALDDGRWIVASGRPPRRPIGQALGAIALLAVTTAIAAWPAARRLTRRLERLKEHVAAFGEGRLGVRVPVEGHNEIARLAEAWNDAAARIERLVEDKTRLLANTSHELRTPLARVRMALALLETGSRPEILARIDRDIGELDDLIGELLVASRLDAPERPLVQSPVDLLALAAEEAARRPGITVSGESLSVPGDPRLLRRLVRNLLENALRHGEPPVEVEVARCPDDAAFVRLVVADRGPGVATSERERIFEPFYRPPGAAGAEGGVGLGLALVRQIATRHGGRIACEGRAGGGTRFVLDLPAAG